MLNIFFLIIHSLVSYFFLLTYKFCMLRISFPSVSVYHYLSTDIATPFLCTCLRGPRKHLGVKISQVRVGRLPESCLNFWLTSKLFQLIVSERVGSLQVSS